MKKIFGGVVFHSLAISIWMMLIIKAITMGNPWVAFCWGLIAGFESIYLYKALFIYGGKYKRIQFLSAISTAIIVFCVGVAFNNLRNGDLTDGSMWVIAALSYIPMIYLQRRSFKQSRETDLKVEAMMKEYFPEQYMGDIKLERKA